MASLLEILNNWLSSKKEKTEACFDTVTTQNGIELCDLNTGNNFTSPASLPGLKKYISLYDSAVYNQSLLDYCLDAFLDVGVLQCNKPIRLVQQFIPGEIKCINAIIDWIQLRNSIINNDFFKPISVGKIFTSKGKEIPGCKIVIKDFNPKEGDKFDISKLKDKSYQDIKVFNISINDTSSLAFHISGDPLECTLAIYGYTAEINQSMFVTPQQSEYFD